jgi:methylated-DNA-protein-cysteine methyltransferase related protein
VPDTSQLADVTDRHSWAPPRPFADEIIAVVASLAPGEVASYGDVAHDAGRPGAARAVGALLAGTDAELPWWRVVRADGRIVCGNGTRQADLLRAEGVVVRHGRVVAAPVGRFAGRGAARAVGRQGRR